MVCPQAELFPPRPCALEEDIRRYRSAISCLTESQLVVIPWESRVERFQAIDEFIEGAVHGTIMVFYVPHNRLWANELDRLVSLFREWARDIARYPVTVHETRTAHGTRYEFRVDQDRETSEPQFQDLMGRFQFFISMCATDPEAAENTLLASGIGESRISETIGRYSREFKRLIMDFEYEKRAKLLDIQHRLHAELMDSALFAGGDTSIMLRFISTSSG